jgi:hypothetical protein
MTGSARVAPPAALEALFLFFVADALWTRREGCSVG